MKKRRRLQFFVGLALACLASALPAQTLPSHKGEGLGVGPHLRTDTIQEVVVTGTGTQHLLKNAPVQTEVITQRMLQQYGGRSLEDILSGLTASFAFNEDDMGSQMQMNGLGNSYILILIDGKRIHGDVGGENDLAMIDPANIEKIEIVKGASSALYGSDAIAGVINIITRKHTEQGLLVENTTRGGMYNDWRQHNALGLRFGRFGSLTNFHLGHTDGWQNTATEHTTATEPPITDSRNKTVNRYTNWQVAERLTYEVTRDLELYAAGSLYDKRIYRPNGKYARYDVHTYDLQYHNQSASVGGKWKLGKMRNGDNETMRKEDAIALYVDWNRHAYEYLFTANTLVEDYELSKGTLYYPYFPYLTGQTQMQSDQRRTMATLKGVFTLPRGNRLNAGAEYRYDWLQSPTRVVGQTVSDWTTALYVQDEWLRSFRNDMALHLAGGLRLTGNEQFGVRLTPKASMLWSIGRPWRIRAQWSQGFKTPTTKELYYRYVRQMSGTYLYLGNTSLKPQTSNYLSLGGEYTHRGLSITLTGYYNKVRDMIALVTIPNYQAPAEYLVQYDPVKTRQYQNIEDARTWGIDLSARYTWREFAFGLGYSYLDTEANQYDTNHDRMHQVTIDGMAHHKGNVMATWNHRIMRNGENEKMRNVGVGLYGRMSSKRFYQIDGNGKGYQKWKVTGNYEFSPSRKAWKNSSPKGKVGRGLLVRIEAGVDNILNYVDRTPHGLHLGTTTPGTTVFASLSVRFNQGKKITNTNSINQPNYKQDEQD